MTSNVYCPFCGVILLPDPYRDDPASSQTRLRPWYAEVRGIYSASTLGSIGVTGLGIIRARNTLYAPLESNLSYTGAAIEALQDWRICGLSDGRWCFGIHNSCWDLLLLRLGNGQGSSLQDVTAIAESVFYLLYCTPCFEASRFQFGHDYEGAAQTHKSFGRIKAINLSSHLYADPCVIPSTEDLEATALGFWKTRKIAVDSHSKDGTCASALLEPLQDMAKGFCAKLQRPNPCIFDKLSAEVRFEIFSYLSFDELLNLRLVCRGLALFATISALPQSYWRSRFFIGQEADFLFPRLKETRNWSRLFVGTSTSLSNGVLPLVNRKRIMKLLEPIAALSDLAAVLRSGPYGTVLCPAQNNNSDNFFQCLDSTSSEKPSSLMQIANCFSGRLSSLRTDGPLVEGCRAFYHRAQSLKAPGHQNQQRIGISMIQVGARSFVSGINLFPGAECNDAGRGIGYRIPASEKRINIPCVSDLRAICVAFCSEGLTGIRFIFGDSNSSDWVGDTRSPRIAFGTLTIQEGQDWPYLVAGLDCFKVVSLGLGKITSYSGVPTQSPSDDVINSPQIQSSLWAPHPPSEKDLKISTILPFRSSRVREPLINIDFGGPRGLLLGALARLTFHMRSGLSTLAGIGIFYSDGKSSLYGSRSGCEISFFVNGPHGERINQVGIFEDNRCHPEITLGGLQVSTNYGRTASFATLHSRLNASVKQIPVLPFDHTITGFVAIENAVQTRFTRIGIQCQPCDDRSTTADIFDHGSHQVPDYQLRYDASFAHFIDGARPGNYQTYASLRNVRRIQASTGIQGRSRSSNRISGLKIEYFDHPSPTVLGQWMNEVDNCFELSPDEKLQSLTICLAPVGFSTECPGLEIGQVAAIHIETTHSRNMTFRSSQDDSLPHQRLRDQYQSDSGEELVAISWILNVFCDRVRAVSSANISRQAQILVPDNPPPFDQVQKLYFTIHDSDSYSDTAVTAKAFFRDRAIIGIIFVYSSGKIAKIGDVDAVSHQAIRFPRDSRVVSFCVAAAEDELWEIEFEVESYEQPTSRRLRLPTNSARGPVNSVTAEYDWRDVWWKDATSAESCQPLLVSDRVYKPPSKSKLVGIYVRCQGFDRVGAIYEPETHQ